jgi:hypothetical protein
MVRLVTVADINMLIMMHAAIQVPGILYRVFPLCQPTFSHTLHATAASLIITQQAVLRTEELHRVVVVANLKETLSKEYC